MPTMKTERSGNGVRPAVHPWKPFAGFLTGSSLEEHERVDLSSWRPCQSEEHLFNFNQELAIAHAPLNPLSLGP